MWPPRSLGGIAVVAIVLALVHTFVVGNDHHPSQAATASPLNVWIVPHTHDDTGWLRTVDEYYEWEVQYILDTVISSLLENPKRKFQYVEMAFFRRWWNDQNDSKKDAVRKLVANKQLEFVLGGWCMNDEAVTNFEAIINQMTYGHQFLLREFGYVPKIAWHIDPFGASSVTPSLWAQAGFKAFVINRIDWRQKLNFKANKHMEFIWRGSKSLNSSAQIFTHVLSDHYCTPDGPGPWPKSYLNGYDWEHAPCQDMPTCDGPPPIIINPPSLLMTSNIQERADLFVNISKSRARDFATPNILIPFGCDFTFQNAHMMYKNMDRLIEYINTHPERYGDIHVQYCTLSEYFEAVMASSHNFPVWTRDFLPYADNEDSYWTGFYVSRPTVKALSRRSDAILTRAEQLFSIARLFYPVDGTKSLASLDLMRDATALVQHHDGVTGTEKQHVANDYAARLEIGASACAQVSIEMIEQLAQKQGHKPSLSLDPAVLSNNLARGDVTPIIVHNQLSWTRRQYVRIPVDRSDIQVTHSSGKAVPYQVNPSIGPHSQTPFTLFFMAELPPMGFETYFAFSNKTVTSSNTGQFVRARGSAASYIENEYMRVGFDENTGLMNYITNLIEKQNVSVVQDFIAYIPSAADQTSGAYIFRPTNTSIPYENLGPAQLFVLHGDCVDEMYQVWKNSQVVQVVRLYKKLDQMSGSFVETNTSVGPVDISRGGREIVTRYSTNLNSGKTFYTDDSGMEMQTRTRLPTGRLNDSDSGVMLSGNYYPIVSRAYIRDEISKQTQFTAITEYTQGGSSLNSGQLEVMLHRRLVRDDWRGVGEPLNETTVASPTFVLTLSSPTQSARLHRRLATVLSHPTGVFFGSAHDAPSWVNTYNMRFLPLVGDLPENVRILSMSARDASASGEVIFRLMHIFEVDEHPTLSSPAIVDLSTMFAAFQVVTVQELTLTANQPLVFSGTVVKLAPMQIRTFVVRLKSLL